MVYTQVKVKMNITTHLVESSFLVMSILKFFLIVYVLLVSCENSFTDAGISLALVEVLTILIYTIMVSRSAAVVVPYRANTYSARNLF